MAVEVKENRSIWKYFLLTLVTCGIYSYFFYYDWIKDVNEICDGDGEETPGLLKYILLSVVTCGIYGLIWEYNIQNRLNSNGTRYGVVIQETGSTVLLWQILGSWLLGAGWLFALHIMFQSTNKLAYAYNHNGSAGGSRNVYEPNIQPQLPPAQNSGYGSVSQEQQNGMYQQEERSVNDSAAMGQETQTAKPPAASTQGIPSESRPAVPKKDASATVRPAVPNSLPADDPGLQIPVTQPVSQPSAATGQMQQNTAVSSGAMGKIQCVKGVSLGQGFRLPPKAKVVVGKNPAKANLVINDTHVSNVHCSVQYNAENNTYIVTDHSTNGTYVNGTRLQKDVPVSCPEGTVLSLVDGSNQIKLG